jgi:hypothetical protein
MSRSTRRRVGFAAMVVSLAALLLALVFAPGVLQAQRGAAPADGYLTGVVQGPSGPEAGVWVVAETKDLPTNFIKIVVTDDQGRFMVPELPAANYSVWVRGYGLVDSAKVQTKPTPTAMTLRVQAAKTPQEAAKVYPGNYWLSMLEIPSAKEFPGTGNPPQGNGIGAGMTTQANYVHALKSNCNFCHQLGNAITRDLSHVFKAKPEFKTHEEAWEWRLGTGVRGSNMYSVLNQQGQARTLKAWADWSRAIEKGAAPPAPPRPRGVERNLVLTLWDWGTDHSFMHDEITTDRNRPTVNGGGPVYAVSAGHGQLVILDPKTNRTEELDIPTRAPREQVPSRFPRPNRPSLWWGDQWLWSNPPYNPADPHNPMLDSKGRVWMTTKIRPNQNPAWCTDPANKFAAWYPVKQSARQAGFYDPKTKQFTLVDTCYSTHHLYFDTDASETVYFNELGGALVGWVDTKVFDETKDEHKAVGWCGQVVDTNGDGRITRPWNQRSPGAISLLYAGDTAADTSNAGRGGRGGDQTPLDPKLDTQIVFNLYGVMPSPADNSVWGASESFPGYIVRVDRGSNPPESCMTEVYRVPAPGLDPRGIDVDTNGVVWTALAASSHLASFDRRKCKSLTGPRKFDGSDCPEGWTLYLTNGPKLKGTEVPADFHYYNWVDRHNIMGFGENTPMATGSNSDSLLVLNPQTRQWVTLRVPYPLGFYSRGLDGRIDDAKAGWKGRGLWANYGTHFVWHIEGGKGTKGKMVHFQLRDNPMQR